MVRIAHATDIHWFVPPPWSRLGGKRLLGAANLYLRGRRKEFDPVVQQALVDHLVDLDPDAVVITGDLTAQALPEEFALAREALQPVLDGIPTLVQCGNHDVYTAGSKRSGRLAEWFGPWMALEDGPVARFDIGHVTVLGLDPNRPHWSASGRLPAIQLDALRDLLDSDDLEGRTIFLALHYPVLDRRGDVYDNRTHGLRNASDFLDLLRAAHHKPVALLHGHKHHGYKVELPIGGEQTAWCYNPGAAGYAFLPDEDRAACMNLYTVRDDGFVEVERYRYDGAGFSPEPGGAYATGR